MSTLNVGVLNTTGSLKLAGFSTANKPASPQPGLAYYNTDLNNIEIWSGSAWLNFSGETQVAATGGNVATSGDYKIHTFTSDGVFTVTSADSKSTVELLVVAGGGGTGWDVGGGGGGGGVIHYSGFGVSVGSYSITIGGGGSSGQSNPTKGTNGSNSSFGNITATGGGGGGAYTDNGQGLNGGSGGGGGDNGYLFGLGIDGQGHRGGRSNDSTWASGGGGGSGSKGYDALTPLCGDVIRGGQPVYYDISGTMQAYGGGGYGNCDGGTVRPTGQNYAGTTIGTYGFGANGTGSPNGNPSGGSQGIVIVRYLYQ